MNGNHEWKLVAPWYRWQRQFDADGSKPWQTRPVFQKFDQNDYVKVFTADPQRSLKFLPIDDTVFNTSLKDVAPLSGVFTSPPPDRFTKLYAPKKADGSPPEPKEARMVPTGIRKLYLPTHKRFYLVVCELHCYVAGFPMVTRDQVCQSGFVVRRRGMSIPPANQKQALKDLEKIQGYLNNVNADIAYWLETAPATGRKAKQRAAEINKAKANGTFATKLNELKLQREFEEGKLADWKKQYGVTAKLEGWIPTFFEQTGAAEKQPLENVGSWQPVEETPQQLKGESFPKEEAYFPLFALFPDPNIPKHSGKGRNIYFGPVPASSFDTDQSGKARFDSDVTYEIRCFVRRHKAGCPRLDKTPDCHGPIVWSEPTEVYKLAPATDLLGTSNRPITIRMPDFAELAAQAAALPANKLAPVRVEKPQSMNFKVEDGEATGGGIGGFQICFFSIPLITIVAMFLLQLFLPIVVFLFGLFFLLALKFCIPPSLSVGADLTAKLDVLMPKLELDASIDVDVEFSAELEADLGFDIDDLNDDFLSGIPEEHGIKDEEGQLAQFSNEALLPIGENIYEAKSLVGDDGMPKPEAGVDITASVDYEPRVEVNGK